MPAVQTSILTTPVARRRFFMGGVGLAAALALPACTTTRAAGGSGAEPIDAARRLMTHSTRTALDRLAKADGFWNSAVARIELPVLFNRRNGPLAQETFRNELKHKLNNFAEAAVPRAAPLIDKAVRDIDAAASATILRGEPTAGTTLLRQAVGPAAVNALIPALDDILKRANDPVVAQAVAALPGVTLVDVAHALALGADNSIWYEIGVVEADVRADPSRSGDAVLIRALGKA